MHFVFGWDEVPMNKCREKKSAVKYRANILRNRANI